MADSNDQPVKTPPAMPSAHRRSSTALQSRPRYSSRPSRAPLVGEVGDELDFAEFLADDPAGITPGYWTNHAGFDPFLNAQPNLTSDFATTGSIQGQIAIDNTQIDPQLEGPTVSSWTQSQTRKASQNMVANPFTALPSFSINDFSSYYSPLSPTQLAYSPSHAERNPREESDSLFLSQGSFGNFPLQEYPNQPYYNNQTYSSWISPQGLHPVETYASEFDSTLPPVNDSSAFQYPDPTYASTVSPYRTTEQQGYQSRNRSEGILSPVSRKGRTTSRSNNSSYSSRLGRSPASTDANDPRKLDRFRKVCQQRSVIRNYEPEKPKPRDDKSWVRTNATTRGLTTRTGKINNYKAPYINRPPPNDWHYFVQDKDGKQTRVDVKYTKDGEIAQNKLSAREIKNFIFRYRDNEERPGSRLKLWIQRCPTDSARRYFNKGHSKCRFADCPAVVNQTGTILHGHYRVAFDEMWLTHGTNNDPYFASMYVHLYCMERFLDFKAVCTLRNIVEVDSRELLQEPKGRWAASLHAQPESTIAGDFVKLCRGEINYMNEFENYPIHSQYRRGAEKPHEYTLTYYMHEAKESTRPQAQVDQFIVDRVLKRTHILVHKGNLEIMFGGVKNRKKKARKGKNKKRASGDEDNNNVADSEKEDPLIESILKQIALNRGQIPRGGKRNRAPSTDDKRTRESEEESEEEEFKNPNGNDSDEDSVVGNQLPSQGSRSSARIAKDIQANGPKHYVVDNNDDIAQEPLIGRSRTRKRSEEESSCFEASREIKRAKLVSSQGTAVQLSNKRVRSPTVRRSTGSQFERPFKRQNSAESSASRLSVDSNGLSQIFDFGGSPSSNILDEDAPAPQSSNTQAPSQSKEEVNEDIDLGEFDYLFKDLERRQSSISSAIRRRSRGLSLLKSTGGPRITRATSVTFAEKDTTREFRKDDPPRKSPSQYHQVDQEPRRSGRTKKAQSTTKPRRI